MPRIAVTISFVDFKIDKGRPGAIFITNRMWLRWLNRIPLVPTLSLATKRKSARSEGNSVSLICELLWECGRRAGWAEERTAVAAVTVAAGRVGQPQTRGNSSHVSAIRVRTSS